MRTIHSVQMLRAIAALMVLAVHFDTVRLMLLSRGAEATLLYPLASGVDLFFVISGFIMVHSSETLFAAPGGSATFIIRRLARIVPLYWLTTLAAIPLMSLPVSAEALAGSFFFIPYHGLHGAVVPLNGVGWSLNYEMFFYVLMSAALVWSRAVAATIVCAMLGCFVVAGYFLPTLPTVLAFWSDPITLEFGFGIGMALIYRTGLALPVPVRLLLIAAGAAAIWWSAPGLPPTGNRIVTWGIPAAMVFAGAVLGQLRTSVGHVTSALSALGDASYALYLIHPLVGAVIFWLWPLGLYNFPMIVIFAVALVFTVSLSMAIYHFGERKTTRALQRLAMASFFGATRAPAPAPNL